jgi:hypothetical protein
MGVDVVVDEHAPVREDPAARVLFVAWRNPDTRSIIPIARLVVRDHNGAQTFEFRYLTRAPKVLARPLVSFPSFTGIYRSERLFPFFENRMVPTQRSDFRGWAASLGLSEDSDPFEILAQSGGTRVTDTFEVFPEPAVDREVGLASVRILVRGVRHREGANEEIDRLRPGDALRLCPEPDNGFDALAVLVVPSTCQAVGWVPAYLCGPLHRSAASTEGSWAAMKATVRHIGDPLGPSHFRLLCDLQFPWPYPDQPFDTPEFSVAST